MTTLEEAKKLLDEEYERAKRLEYVKNPLAFALYQVWKKTDGEKGGSIIVNNFGNGEQIRNEGHLTINIGGKTYD